MHRSGFRSSSPLGIGRAEPHTLGQREPDFTLRVADLQPRTGVTMRNCCGSIVSMLSRKLGFDRCVPLLLLLLVVSRWSGLSRPLVAAEIDQAQLLFNSGKYAECIEAAARGIEDRSWRESWWVLKARAELETGRYCDALVTLEKALDRFPSSIALRLLGRQVYRFNDWPERAEERLAQAEEMVRRQSWRYSDPVNRVVLGRLFLLRGADAKQVLEIFFDRSRRDRPDHLETYLASGELALEKHDYALAAEAFQGALKLAPDDPAVHFGLARAHAPSDAARAAAALSRALEINPHHADSLLLMADRLIDREQYEQADELLERVLSVHSTHPLACAYRAVLKHLDGDESGEQSWRLSALAHWPTNPEVDYAIGRKLSQKYRFREGAAHQRLALALDPSYLPAKMQLSQDLLRLGEEEEGWRLAEEVYQADGYNVAAYNLVTLRETLAKFKTLQSDGFLLRMEAHEADVYGHAALELLDRARRALSAKYDVKLERPIVVEIFPERKDFAVRTFGMPGGEGFLGVCFGDVITANSPAAQGGSPSNWKAMLWHELCHVVTLSKTNNKMPRWLSEGISVYEEKQEDPAWGESMNARYRKMVLDGELTPVSGLSGAFLDPPSPLHLQFAYYQASLVVEYLAETYGLETVKRILADLSAGTSINVALERHAGPLAELDEQFAKYAEQRARQLASQADWEPPELPPDADLEAIARFSAEHPDNLPGLQLLAERLLRERKWQEAKEPLTRLLALFPEDVGADNAYSLLAGVHRELGETEAEGSVLKKLAALDADALEAHLRLTELCEASEDWPAVAESAERALAVNPLIRAPHRSLARAAEAINDPRRAIHSYRALLQMDPVDPADAHFRLASLLFQEGDLTSARREVLKALEEAPRFRAAHRLLLEIVDRTGSQAAPPGPDEQAAEQGR